MNIIEPILAQCRNKPSELALCAPDTKFNLVSYARLQRCVDNICGRIISAGIPPRSRIAVLIEDPILHAMIVMALTRIGVITFSGGRREIRWPFKIDGAIADRQPEALAGYPVLIADAGWAEGDGRPIAEKYLYRAMPNDACRIFLASGNVQPAGVAMTHGMIVDRLDRQKPFLGPRAPFCDRTHLDLPLGRPLGFQVLLGTLWRGGALVMTGNPRKTLAALTAYEVQNIVAAPLSLLKLVDAVGENSSWCSSLVAVFSLRGMGQELANSVRIRLCQNLTVGYMANDGTMVASAPVPISGHPETAGYLLPGVMAEIVDDNDRVLPQGFEGHLRIRSDYGVSEYFEDPEATKRAFRNGWFYPGDRGHVTVENSLVLSRGTASDATTEDEL
jgi:acyl-CoA synthetase (AMP-forming)/AMP-acid ligase II